MLRKLIAAALAAAGVMALAAPALAEGEQFLPALVYRTGPYAPNGIPFADGVADYWTLVNERDGGINGVKIVYEECETGYATDKGVECYERLKGKGPTGAGYFSRSRPASPSPSPRRRPATSSRCSRRATAGRRAATARCSRGTSSPWAATGPPPTCHPAHRQGARWLRQAQGQEGYARLPRQPLRQGADPGPGGSRQAQRLHLQGGAGHPSGRASRSRSGWPSPGPPRLRAAVGLGRDELHRRHRGRGRGLSARQDDRRMVVGRRA